MDPIMKDLPTLWMRRTAGGPVTCDSCRGLLLLSVGARTYRWRCQNCGRGSVRFEVGRDGRVRASTRDDAAFARLAIVGARLAAYIAELKGRAPRPPHAPHQQARSASTR